MPRKGATTPERAYQAHRDSTARNTNKIKAKWGTTHSHTYGGILKRFDTLKPTDFRAWLVGKITELGGAEALAEYESKRAEDLDKASLRAHKRACKTARAASEAA